MLARRSLSAQVEGRLSKNSWKPNRLPSFLTPKKAPFAAAAQDKKIIRLTETRERESSAMIFMAYQVIETTCRAGRDRLDRSWVLKHKHIVISNFHNTVCNNHFVLSIIVLATSHKKCGGGIVKQMMKTRAAAAEWISDTTRV